MTSTKPVHRSITLIINTAAFAVAVLGLFTGYWSDTFATEAPGWVAALVAALNFVLRLGAQARLVLPGAAMLPGIEAEGATEEVAK